MSTDIKNIYFTVSTSENISESNSLSDVSKKDHPEGNSSEK